ncbi:MAG: prepilin-type N-terminal cleavage/methylation domain-containing protein [Dyella sp.]
MRQRGFSLLEVIAAVLLLALAFAALMQVAASATNLTARAAERSEAALWARSKLDSAFALRAPQPGQSEGSFDALYRWRLTVTSWPGNEPAGPARPAQTNLQLYRLDLEVLWGQGRQQRHAHFSSLRVVSAHDANTP